MRLLIGTHIANAYQSLTANRMRTVLTMLGVTIGVASVTAILALMDGAVNLVGSQINQLDGNIAVIRSGAHKAKDNFSLSQTQTQYSTTTLTEDDLLAIQDTKHLAAVAPLMNLRTSLRAYGETLDGTNHSVVATTPDLIKIGHIEIRDGQFIDSVSDANTAVVGPQLAIDLFGTEQAIGKTLRIRDQAFIVIGVLKRTNNPVNYNDVDFDRSVLVSLESGKAFTQNVAQIQQINLKADTKEHLPAVVASVKKTIKENHQGENDFSVLSGQEIAEPTSALFRGLSLTSAIVAGISLIVGGVGIMNIMLVNVAERTREIGIRKAVGASNNDIVWQFLIESLAISLGGGLAGFILGYIIALGASAILPFFPAFSWPIALTAFLISVIIGVTFGMYPAIRAAQKDPIESLRHAQ